MSSLIRMKEWVDKASYEELIEKWNKAKIGDPYFQGEMGDYYELALIKGKAGMSGHAVAQANKRFGKNEDS